jgi:hypothetical protein
MADHHPHAPAASAPHHEHSDVNVRAIFGFAAALVGVAVFLHVAVWLLFLAFNNREAAEAPREFPLAASQAAQLPPEPRLQTTPRQDLKDLRANEDRRLQGYGWVDRNAGIVHIPIDVAMKRVVEQGLPSRPMAKETQAAQNAK